MPIVLAAIGIPGCARDVPIEWSDEIAVETTTTGIRIEATAPIAIDEIRILDERGRLVQRILASGERRRRDLPVRWRAGERHVVEIEGPWGVVSHSITAPKSSLPLSAAIELPPGQETIRFGESNSSSAIVPANSAISLGLLIENKSQSPAHYELEIVAEAGIEISSDDPRLIVEIDPQLARVTARLVGELELEFDYDQVICELRASGHGGRLDCIFRQWQTDAQDAQAQSMRIALETATAEQLAAAVRVDEIIFPADPLGRRATERAENRVTLSDPVWQWIRRLLRPASQMFDFHAPYAYQAVVLTNRSQAPLGLVIESEVADARSGEPLLEFAPPTWKSPRESPTAEYLLRLGPGETAAARMPFYVRGNVTAGRYERRFRIVPLGGSQPIAQLSASVYVERGNPIVSGVVLLSLVATLSGWAAIALFGRRVVRRIGTRGLAIIGLVSGVHFIVSYAARLTGDLLWSVIGPFSVFVAGLGNEGLTSMLVVVVVALVPRVGTLTLSNLAVFLLNAMFTGQLGVVDVLFVTVSSVVGETLLALFGITVAGSALRSGARPRLSTVVRFAAAIGIANAATLYAQFCLVQVLHRLFFAGWYIAAVALVTGLVYGAVGAAAGTWLGFELRRASL